MPEAAKYEGGHMHSFRTARFPPAPRHIWTASCGPRHVLQDIEAAHPRRETAAIEQVPARLGAADRQMLPYPQYGPGRSAKHRPVRPEAEGIRYWPIAAP